MQNNSSIEMRLSDEGKKKGKKENRTTNYTNFPDEYNSLKNRILQNIKEK
jgi:hypothetical protein